MPSSKGERKTARLTLRKKGGKVFYKDKGSKKTEEKKKNSNGKTILVGG